MAINSTVARDALNRLASIGTPDRNPDVVLETTVGLDEIIKQIETESLPFLNADGSFICFVQGAYGRGKTHLLRVVEAVARQKGFVTAYAEASAEKAPFESMAATYRRIAQQITGPLSENTGLINLLREARDLSNVATIAQHVRSDVCLAHDFRNLVAAVVQNLDVTALSGLRELLVGSPTARVSFPALFRDYPTLPRPLGRLVPRTGASWLRSLASLPRALGYPGFLILFDETEVRAAISRKGPRTRQEHLANLRNLVDHVAAGALRGCGIVYAVTDDLLEIAKRDLAALFQRVARYSRRFPNPRAIWMDLDELTNPRTDQDEFFEKMANRLIALAQRAGGAGRLSRSVRDLLAQLPRTTDVSAVRVAVKAIAADLCRDI